MVKVVSIELLDKKEKDKIKGKGIGLINTERCRNQYTKGSKSPKKRTIETRKIWKKMARSDQAKSITESMIVEEAGIKMKVENDPEEMTDTKKQNTCNLYFNYVGWISSEDVEQPGRTP